MSNTTMQAIRVHDYGGPEALVLEQVPRPQPQADQVLIRILAAGVNPADWKYRAGLYKEFVPLSFPWTPGLEAAGIIEAVGADALHSHRVKRSMALSQAHTPNMPSPPRMTWRSNLPILRSSRRRLCQWVL